MSIPLSEPPAPLTLLGFRPGAGSIPQVMLDLIRWPAPTNRSWPPSPTGDYAAAIKQVFLHYLDSYFSRRDLASTVALFDTEMSGFGTDRDETTVDACS
ncbi:hypothetical protein [Rhabdochromatium marinum]|uniref:hypothetical protein n=1 Tax=Rhabdochromatium marinum TaxID=48729 RepID=UPI0019050E3E|nr:hypothetical protein [Rhabdochromatium marinum]MBK1648823.1 hypothetical protein [Rhabdochromatium marinum]